MPIPAVTYIFANSTTGDAVQVNRNFTDLINGSTDGTKDHSVAALTAAGKFSCAAKFVTSAISSVVATNSGTATIADSTHVVILSPASSISSYSLTLPGLPNDGHRVIITSGGNDITSLTVSPNSGQSLASGVVVPQMRAGNSTEFVYRTNIWYLAGCGGRAPTNTQTKIGALGPGSGVYSTPTGCNALYLVMVGGGGGGAGSGLGVNGNGAAGQDTIFGSFTAGGGAGASGAASAKSGGAGGTPSDPGVYGFAIYGGQGEGNIPRAAVASIRLAGGIGGGTPFGSGGPGFAGGAGVPAAAGTPIGAGGGGGGAGATANGWTGAGGGAGAYMELMIPSPSASYSYSIGSFGTGGSAGTNGNAGGNGSQGIVYITELYS